MWDVGEGRAQRLLSVCEPKSSPTSHLKWGGERVPGCRRLWVERVETEGTLRADQAEAFADVDAPVWRAFRRSLRAVPKQFTEQTREGHGRWRKSFRQQILQGEHSLPASAALLASRDARACLGSRFSRRPGGFARSSGGADSASDSSRSLLASEEHSNEGCLGLRSCLFKMSVLLVGLSRQRLCKVALGTQEGDWALPEEGRCAQNTGRLLL